MPYLKRAKENRHECHPPMSQRGMRSAGAGSVWACERCGQQWIIETNGEHYRWRPATEAEQIPVETRLAERGPKE
jgi:ribosomal protein L37AE/L43A